VCKGVSIYSPLSSRPIRAVQSNTQQPNPHTHTIPELLPSTKCWKMAQSIQSSAEQMLYSSDNASSTSTNPLSPVTSGSFFLQPRVAIGFSLLLLIVLARVFGAGKQKLPPGVKRLPRLPGTYLVIVVDTPLHVRN